jgi:hypothetical protein
MFNADIALENIRNLAAVMLAQREDHCFHAIELAEAINALDIWLKNDGNLPDEWSARWIDVNFTKE